MFRPLRIAAAALIAATIPFAHARKEREVSIGLQAAITSIDPHYHNLSPNNSLLQHIFEPLIRRDANQKLIPALATSWKALDDLTWEFKLRKNVRFHDGTPFTAEDVVFTLESAPTADLCASPNHPYTEALIAEVPQVDARRKHYVPIRGEIPSPLAPPTGCHFHPRCPKAFERCRAEAPPLIPIAPGRLSACHLNELPA